MAYIEYIQGSESHTSNWGKFYVKGLESFVVDEDHEGNKKDKHHQYSCKAGEVPEGTIFTVFYQDGNKRGTDTFKYLICEAIEAGEVEKHDTEYGNGFLEGEFKILAQGLTKTKALRLMGWWINSADKSKAFALHCAAHIDKRGLKTLPAMPAMKS